MSNTHPSLDLIGDIHGHADELEALLKKLGYKSHGGAYRHDEGRTVVFLGDYIDRGPKIKETLTIVRGMVVAGTAVALMGNHEYNAICFHYEAHKGGHVRKHLIKNILQHVETLRQFRDDQNAYNGWIEWFKTLPLYVELPGLLRAVHACWDQDHIATLRRELRSDRLNEDLIHRMVNTDDPLHLVIEETLKGKEVKLPGDEYFLDKDGNPRHHIRYKWWMDPAGKTYKELSVLEGKFADEPVPPELIDRSRVYGPGEPPVFFGHYWLKGVPEPYADNVCCLDYSVAKSKKDSIGRLVAYSFDGEQKLDPNKFTWVEAPPKP